jgi:hypothetical protein
MRRTLIVILIAIIFVPGYSQKWKLTRYEAIAGIGTTSFFGDIGGYPNGSNLFGLKDISLLSTRPSLYLGARYKIQQDKSIKFNLIFAWFNRKDNPSINYQEARNYSFNTFAIEHSLQFEYSFVKEDRHRFSFALFNRRGMLNNYSKIGLYGFAGLGGLLFKPGLNGQIDPKYETKKTSLGYTMVLPVGIGVKLIYNNKYAFGFELGGRYVLSDYVDGLSTQYSHHKDVYYFGVFNLVYRIKTSIKGYPILFNNSL